MAEPLSRTKVNKAGKLLRDFYRGGKGVSDLEPEQRTKLLRAVLTAQAYRSTFSVPLVKVRMGLKSFVQTTDLTDPSLSQRHKRVTRIVQKLARPDSTMQLAQMQDIGGCRVVVADLVDLRRLEKHIMKRWSAQVVKVSDYVEAPKPDGYRALHIVVLRDERLIEVQLRTEFQHEWANHVERLDRRYRLEMKAGSGPPELLNLMAVLSDLMAYEELGETPPAELLLQFAKAREAAGGFSS